MKRLIGVLLGAVLLYGAPAQRKDTQEPLMRLGLQALLYNSDLRDAWHVVRKEIQKYPNDPWWLQKAAEIAAWTNHPQQAKRYYLRLYRRHPSTQLEHRMLALSKTTEDYDLQIDLLERRVTGEDPARLQTLFDAYYARGHLRRGARFFSRLYRRHPDARIMKMQLSLLFEYAPLKVLRRTYRHYRRRYGTDAKLAYRYAHALFAHRMFGRALRILAEAKNAAPFTMHRFWRLYIDLSFLLRDDDTLYPVLKKMFHAHALEYQEYAKLLYYAHKYDPMLEEQVACDGWRRFSRTHLLYRCMALLSRRHAYARMERLLSFLPDDLIPKMHHDLRYWLLKAEIDTHFKRFNAARRAYRHAIRLAPRSVEAAGAYLWFLIDRRERAALERELERLRKNGIDRHLLSAMASGYLLLQRSADAKRYLGLQIHRTPHDWQLRLLYSDLLMLWQDRRGAHRQMRIAWKLARKEVHRTKETLQNRSKLFDYLRLKLYFHPRQMRSIMAQARTRLTPDQCARLQLGFLTSQVNEMRVVWLQRRYHLKMPWLRLYTALAHDDGTEMASLLAREGAWLPIADKARAQRRIGALRDAQSTLFDGLEHNPRNRDLYTLFHEKAASQEKRNTLLFRRRIQSDLHFAETSLQLRTQLPSRTYLDTRFIYRSDLFATFLPAAHLPRIQSRLDLRLERIQQRWRIAVGSHLRSGMRRASGWSLEGQWREGSVKLSALAGIALPDETTSRIALLGDSDRIALGADFALSPVDTLSVHLHHAHYRDDLGSAGSANGGVLSYARRLRRGYPDIGLHTTLEWEGFRSAKGRLPEDFWQAGIGAQLGDDTRNGFRRGTHPFADVDLYYHRRNGFAYQLRTGLGGMLMQADRLEAELLFARGIGPYTQSFLRLQLRYLWW